MSNLLERYAEGMALLFENSNGPRHSMALYWRWFMSQAQHATGQGLTDKASNASELIRTDTIQSQQCYRNSLLVEYILNQTKLLEHRMEYMEGLVLHPVGIPIEHAFNWSHGVVYDFTTAVHWQEEPLEWYGVVVPSRYAWEWNEATESQRSIYSPLQYYFVNYVLPSLAFPAGGVPDNATEKWKN